MPELIDHMLLISERFGKTLVAIYFNEKHTQSVAQITMQYHESKDFFCFQFVVDQVLSISEYDLENG